VSAHVVAENAKVGQKIVRLPVPQAVVAAQRMNQQNGGLFLIAVKPVKVANSACICSWHLLSFKSIPLWGRRSRRLPTLKM
jgi:hypothetical protein